MDCSYFFTWDTKYACVDEKEALLCGVSDGKQRFDLSALARHSGRPTARSVCARARSLGSFPRARLEMLLQFSLSANCIVAFPRSSRSSMNYQK